jgi:hypothetical protein
VEHAVASSASSSLLPATATPSVSRSGCCRIAAWAWDATKPAASGVAPGRRLDALSFGAERTDE